MSPRSQPIDTNEHAESVALSALVYLTEDGERLERFLTESGLSPSDLGHAAGSPEMLTAVLDYLMADESLLMVFAATANLDPAEIAPARYALGGGKDVNPEGYNAPSNRSTLPTKKRPSRRWAGPDSDPT